MLFCTIIMKQCLFCRLVIENEEFVLISFDHILQIIKSNNLCCKEEVVSLYMINTLMQYNYSSLYSLLFKIT